MTSSPITSRQIEREKVEAVADFIFLDSKITADGDCSQEIKTVAPWKESYDKPRQHIKKQRHYFADKGPSSQSCGFFSSHVQIWELDHQEGWAPQNCCFQIVVLEKTLRVPWTARSNWSILKEVNPDSIGRTDVKALILWPPNTKSQLIGKDSDAGKDWGQEEKGATQSKMVR